MIGGRDYQGNKRAIEVQLQLKDGRLLHGEIMVTGQRGFGEYLNAGPDFLEFKRADGTLVWLSRDAIQQVWEFEIPQADQLETMMSKDRRFDPFEVLGVKPGASMREIHTAYVRLAKLYHPDRYSAVGLPKEMRDYVQDMSKRINAAYTELETMMKLAAEKHQMA